MHSNDLERRRGRWLTPVLLAAWVACCPASAQVWDGGGADSDWSTAANWNPNLAPANNGTALITLGGIVGLAPNVDAAWDILGLTFGASAGGFTVGGSQLTIRGRGIANNSATTQRINTAIRLQAAQTWNATAGDLLLGGAINKHGNTLTFDGPFNTSASGVISGSGAMIKDGAGTVTFSGTAANTLSGTVTINAGAMVLNKTAGLNAIAGARETITIGDGIGGAGADVLRLMADNQILNSRQLIVQSSGVFDLNGNDETIGSGVTTQIRGGAITTGGGTLTVIGTLTFTDGGTIDTGTGTLVLSLAGADTINGDVAGSTGTIRGNMSLGGGPQNFLIDTDVTLDISAAVSNGALSKGNGGRLLLSGDNTYAGGTTLNAGTLALGHNAALGTGVLDIRGGALQAAGGARTAANLVTISSSFAVSGSDDLEFSGDGSLRTSSTITADNTGRTTFSGSIDDGTSTRNLTKAGAGRLVLSGTTANSYDGVTTASAGVLNIQKDGALGSTLNGTVVASGAALELENHISVSGERLTLNGSGVSNGGALRNVSGNNSWSGAITLGSPTAIASDTPGHVLTVSGAIANAANTLTVQGSGDTTITGVLGNGTGGLTKTGTGTLILAAPTGNTFSGPTTISGGLLSVTQPGALAATSGVTLDGGTLSLSGTGNRVNDAAPLYFNGGTLEAPSVTETLGQLNLAAESALTLGAGGAAGRLTFSSAARTGGSLTIHNWSGSPFLSGTDDQLFIATDPGAAFLASVNFTGYGPGAIRLGSGEIVPTPEPHHAALAAGLATLGFGIYWRRQRGRTSSASQAGRSRPSSSGD
jgi:autotransporter-associated beta strand protein